MNRPEDQQEMLIHLIIKWFQQRFYRNRLRDRLLCYAIMSFLINIYVFLTAYRNNAILLFPALLLWIVVAGGSAYVVRKSISTRIVRNTYKEIQTGVKKRVLFVGICLLILYLFQRMKISNTVFHSFVAIPVTLSFFFATVITFVWLLRYESKKGTVLVIKERKS